MNFDPDGFVWQIAPRFDHLLGTGSLRGPAKLQNEANVAGEVGNLAVRSPASADQHAQMPAFLGSFARVAVS